MNQSAQGFSAENQKMICYEDAHWWKYTRQVPTHQTFFWWTQTSIMFVCQRREQIRACGRSSRAGLFLNPSVQKHITVEKKKLHLFCGWAVPAGKKLPLRSSKSPICARSDKRYLPAQSSGAFSSLPAFHLPPPKTLHHVTLWELRWEVGVCDGWRPLRQTRPRNSANTLLSLMFNALV